MVRRPPTERALAWLYTGPLGHLWGAVADISSMWLRWMWLRARTRLAQRLRLAERLRLRLRLRLRPR